MSGDPRETTGLLGARWTAGNRLELTRPNGRRELDPDLGWRTSWWARWGRSAPAVRILPSDSGTVDMRRWAVPVAESVVAPPGPIPNPVVTRDSAGEYCTGNCVGGEAAAGTSHRQDDDDSSRRVTRGGAVAARWAHNPKVGGSNPSPATRPTAPRPPDDPPGTPGGSCPLTPRPATRPDRVPWAEHAGLARHAARYATSMPIVRDQPTRGAHYPHKSPPHLASQPLSPDDHK